MLSFKFKMNSSSKILRRLGVEKDGRANKFLRDEVDRLCDPYVPMDRGTLKNTKQYPSNHEIKYVMPYAHYMYKGKKAVRRKSTNGSKKNNFRTTTQISRSTKKR